jgi:hypothetical protein
MEMEIYDFHERIDQRLANYRPAERLEVACAVCEHYLSDSSCCEKVAGMIRPDYVCDAFSAANLSAMLMDEEVMMSGEYQVAKADDEQQIIFGWANIAVTKSGEQTVDHHADLIDPVELEAAAYDFMLNARVSGEEHTGQVDAECVESIVFTKEKAEALGIPEGILPEAGWWVGFHIPDRDSYLRARDEKRMFSIEGTAIREPVAVEKRTYSASQRETMAESGEAMSDGGYPIRDIADLRNAVQAYGRAADKAATKAHIIRRARALNAESELPEEWMS